jgi:hypothetical protein
MMLFKATLLWPLLHLFHEIPSTSAREASYDTCDENSVPDNKSTSLLTPNTFHKICPGTYDDSKPLSQPVCGDGTAFSFYYHKPKQQHVNNDKIIIEFQGGGACWDSNSCNKQSGMLTFPTDLDGFVGYSCSEVNYGMDNYGGYPINLLCADTMGDMDLSEYNYVFVPYCTQDVHMGDSSSTYADDDSGSGVYHHGAHNMMGVLNWVYKQFPNPSHFFLTGCSAGGTALPVAYDLINNHYNSFLKGGRSVNINTIIDSAVYLTPSYFLEYGIDNWNPWTVLDKMGFPYSEYKYNIHYSTRLWEHALKRGSNKDQWGFVTHTYDPVSIAYWQAMGGGYGDDDNDNDDESTWATDLSTSLTTIQDEYSNVNTFYIEGNGHCSFGLQYALQEDGFEEFAENIIAEQQLIRKTASSLPLFSLSVALGSLLMLASSASRSSKSEDSPESTSKESYSDTYDDDLLPKKNSMDKLNGILSPLFPLVQRYEKCPITSGIFLTTTMYFIIMLLSNGFAHPLNNPSLGPSASTLGAFGINNPTLVVTKNQIFRVLTSPFLCSGILTYLMFFSCTFNCMRHVEASVSSNVVFGTVLFIIAMGSNLIYILVGEGASCGSLAMALGVNAFSIAMSKKYGFEHQFPRLWMSTFFYTLFAVTLFPFNSWIMIVASIFIGGVVAPFLVQMKDYFTVQNHFDRLCKKTLTMISAVYFIIFVLILCNVPQPDKYYQYSYLTGCAMMYTPDLDAIVEDFGGGGRRKLGDYDGFCAQICVPNLIDRPLYWGIGRFTEYDMTRGRCEDIGYDEHAADKTITYFGYSLDIEAYYPSGDDDGN